MTRKALIIFAKNPEAGKVKTRLAATMGDDVALKVYQKLIAITIDNTKDFPADKFVFYSDFIHEDDEWDPAQYVKRLQLGNDLGERMYNAFEHIFKDGYEHVVIIGTDCPALTAALHSDAFSSLEHHDVVAGPAADGGYYLLGLKKNQEHLFVNMQWSTSTVLTETLERLRRIGFSFYLLPVLSDIDEEKDLVSFNWTR